MADSNSGSVITRRPGRPERQETDERVLVTVPIIMTRDLVWRLNAVVENTFPICPVCKFNFQRSSRKSVYCSNYCRRKAKTKRMEAKNGQAQASQAG